VLDYRR